MCALDEPNGLTPTVDNAVAVAEETETDGVV